MDDPNYEAARHGFRPRFAVLFASEMVFKLVAYGLAWPPDWHVP